MPKLRKKYLVEQRLGMTFKEWVMSIASKNGYTQKQMAHMLGVQQVVIGDWLREDDLEQFIGYRSAA